MTNDVGILLRGKSLEKIPLISDKFNDCYLINNFKEELGLFGKYIKGKNIIQFANSMTSSTPLKKDQYKRFNINTIQFSFTKSMYTKKRDLVKFYNEIGVKNIRYLDGNYEDTSRSISNTGVCCIFYVSEFIKPKRIWMAGLEFYHENYLVKKNYSHQLAKTKKIGLVESFINIVKKYPDIEYNLITYYKKLPKIDNLNILEI